MLSSISFASRASIILLLTFLVRALRTKTTSSFARQNTPTFGLSSKSSNSKRDILTRSFLCLYCEIVKLIKNPHKWIFSTDNSFSL